MESRSDLLSRGFPVANWEFFAQDRMCIQGIRNNNFEGGAAGYRIEGIMRL